MKLWVVQLANSVRAVQFKGAEAVGLCSGCILVAGFLPLQTSTWSWYCACILVVFSELSPRAAFTMCPDSVSLQEWVGVDNRNKITLPVILIVFSLKWLSSVVQYQACNYPAISVGLNTAEILFSIIQSLLAHRWQSGFCSRGIFSLLFSLFFFFKQFSFVSILCTLVLRGWGAGKGVSGREWRCIVEQNAVVTGKRMDVIFFWVDFFFS